MSKRRKAGEGEGGGGGSKESGNRSRRGPTTVSHPLWKKINKKRGKEALLHQEFYQAAQSIRTDGGGTQGWGNAVGFLAGGKKCL